MKTMRFLIALVGLTGLALSTHAYADDLTCTAKNVEVTGIPVDVKASITVSVEELVAQCTSASNSKITLVDPAGGVTADILPQETVVIFFTVTDELGNQASAPVTITRE